MVRIFLILVREDIAILISCATGGRAGKHKQTVKQIKRHGPIFQQVVSSLYAMAIVLSPVLCTLLMSQVN